MRLLMGLVAVLCLALAVLPQASAQTSTAPAAQQAEAPPKIDRRKLLVQPRNKDGTVEEVAFLKDPVLWARDKQQAFYGRLSAALRQMKGASPLTAAWTLMLLSFAYGVFHAAGPGHGKAVISAWLLATENELKRGVLISLMSAVIQALTAIVLVSALLLVVASVGSTARSVAGLLESASYAFIALLGAYLLWTGVLLLAPARKALPAVVATRQSVALDDFSSFQPLRNVAAGSGHVHGPDCDCGHAHLPSAQEVKGDWSLARALSLSFAVGVRPCTGAILVLLFASGLGLFWAGIASAFAMAAGTFITVSVIAAIAVYSKKLAARMMRGNARLLDGFTIALRLAGGLAIACLGTILFLGSLGSTNAMM